MKAAFGPMMSKLKHLFHPPNIFDAFEQIAEEIKVKENEYVNEYKIYNLNISRNFIYILSLFIKIFLYLSLRYIRYSIIKRHFSG